MLLPVLSCSDDSDDPFCKSGSCSYEYYDNSQISVIAITMGGAYVEITAGDKQVFRRTYSYNDEPDIIDDELNEILIFELDKDIDSFSLKDDELAQANVLFGRICYCLAGYRPVSSGTLEGEKISIGKWRIRANLHVNDAVGPLTFEAVYD